jgi:hypothetical protein
MKAAPPYLANYTFLLSNVNAGIHPIFGAAREALPLVPLVVSD